MIDGDLESVYRDLHRNPELSKHEVRTAGIVASWLGEHGYEVIESIGGHGVVGILRRGQGPTVLVRADMDALPITEATGLDYASQNENVMHACGHDLHTTCLMGAAAQMASHDDWSGTVIALFQPAEETVDGAQAMLDDGLFEHIPRPDVVLGQHVSPLPAGVISLTPGAAFAATDCLRVTMHGVGGHGSRPEVCVDPVVMAAATVMRLQTLVSRETAGSQTAVLTVGALHAGSKANIISDSAELLLNVRTYDEGVRARILDGITRIVNAEATASGAPRPWIEAYESAPALINDPVASARTLPALQSVVGERGVIDGGPVTGSEDVGLLACAAGAPIVYWLLGGADPALYAHAATREQFLAVVDTVASNHSPHYAPVPQPTLDLGVRALCAAARQWLGG